MSTHQQAIATEQITDIFEKYGVIESVELHSSNRGSDWAHWAHVTFHSDKTAYSALIAELNYEGEMKLISHILPASTWHQPTINARAESIVANSPDETSRPSLLILNDHCLLEVLSYCDLNTKANLWQVCSKTRDLLNQFELPTEKKDYKILWDFSLRQPLQTLKRVQDELKYIGPHVVKLSLVAKANDITQFYRHTYPPALEHILRICSKYSVASIRELELVLMPNEIVEGQNLRFIRPILDKIETLTIENDETWKRRVDIELPNLKHLQLIEDQHPLGGDGGMDLGFLIKNSMSLEKLTLRYEVRERVVVLILEKYLRDNVKLKSLAMKADNFRTLTKKTIISLKNLEELALLNFTVQSDFDNTACLENLLKLRKLGLSFEYRDHNYEFDPMIAIENAGKIEKLESVMLSYSFDGRHRIERELYSKMILTLARKLPRLQHIYINFGVTETVIIAIVKAARNLKTLWMARPMAKTDLNYDFMRTLAGIRKYQFENNADEITVLDLINYDDSKSKKIRKLVCFHHNSKILK